MQSGTSNNPVINEINELTGTVRPIDLLNESKETAFFKQVKAFLTKTHLPLIIRINNAIKIIAAHNSSFSRHEIKLLNQFSVPLDSHQASIDFNLWQAASLYREYLNIRGEELSKLLKLLSEGWIDDITSIVVAYLGDSNPYLWDTLKFTLFSLTIATPILGLEHTSTMLNLIRRNQQPSPIPAVSLNNLCMSSSNEQHMQRSMMGARIVVGLTASMGALLSYGSLRNMGVPDGLVAPEDVFEVLYNALHPAHVNYEKHFASLSSDENAATSSHDAKLNNDDFDPPEENETEQHETKHDRTRDLSTELALVPFRRQYHADSNASLMNQYSFLNATRNSSWRQKCGYGCMQRVQRVVARVTASLPSMPSLPSFLKP